MKRVPFFDNPVLRGQLPTWRARLVLVLLMAGFVVLAGRALYLQGLSTEFLQQQGERRYERTLTLAATRGKILDRNGVVLASSVPARAIWAIPEDAKPATAEQLTQLAKLLGLSVADLRGRLSDLDRNFVYLKRQVPTDLADQIKKLEIPGIYQQAETRRYYPDGEVTAHLVGFTNVEDKGQEGVELTFDKLLSGTPGSRRVIKDRLGRVIEDVQAVTMPINGRDLSLSIDARLQYLVYRELTEALQRHQASAASAIIMDVRSGEILAMASLPTFDPNDRDSFHTPNLRNRAITDTFEPGSIMKPFTAALALDLGRITERTQFETGNGSFRYQGSTIHDVSRNGTLNVAGVLRRSSNIGMTLIAEKLQAREMWERFTEMGFGRAPQLGFPGAAPGRLRPWDRWRLIEKATMAYGYGLSVSLLQVARAYTVFARDGDMVTPTLVKRDSDPTSVKIYSPQVAAMVRSMLEASAGPEGAKAAQVQGYRVAGKSGTARKIVDGRYSTQRYRSSFVGFAPVSNPRIVVAISIDEPKAGGYYGGAVAAPIFSTIVGGSLRVMGVQPDAPFESTIVAGVKESAR
ncbi:peptidoglycan D,D-transpeptidase FtsI family protein [Bordetella sp. 02P26C-1]|uniref:peptidoglycan D,D-transpeptidase FtsI family protein n=1 Tax=Bordetella sp. 02P26C-1 TaxID=2683195 RepID=UPI001354CF79|nr:penicillin-binding protein 2 [Bordetella sp. 02P26C-1]MVW80795.1 penicillin-binding protein 2 [Bordetella sp. 02P26C-1]